MIDKVHHLLWGILLFALTNILFAMELPLMRLGNALDHSQILAVMAAGEVCSMMPFVCVIKQNWSLRTDDKVKCVVFIGLGLLMAFNYTAQIVCSQLMPIGNFLCLRIATSLIVIPLISVGLNRRCVNLEDVFGIAAALAGVCLVTKPTFIFGSHEDQTTPIYAYFLAIFCGFPLTLSNFVIGYYPDVHWSTYLALRTSSMAIFSAILLTATGYWTRIPQPYLNSNTVKGGESHSLWVSILASLTNGFITNIYRASSIFGCLELELYAVGAAGIIGNIVSAADLAISATFAYLFFGEVMSFCAVGGAVLIALAILIVMGIRVLRQKQKGSRREEDEERKKLLRENVEEGRS